MHQTNLKEAKAFYARQMAASSGSTDPRFKRIFEQVPREDFLGRGPWKVMVGGYFIETPSSDPAHIYHNVLVALDIDKGINNGEPILHAKWIGSVAPASGEAVTHIGAGTGYYSAILSMFTLPGGHVTAFEIDENLAAIARQNLALFENVSVIAGDAASMNLPASDLIYVNAAVSEPPEHWLDALNPGGRMVFPWRPAPNVGMAIVVKRINKSFEVEPLMPVWFIPCVGAYDLSKVSLAPDMNTVWQVRSAYLKRDRKPDATALAIGENLWFSSEPVPE